MKIENLRSLIRESINEYINKIDEEGNAAMYTAKKQACEAAIEARQQKLTRIDESDDLKELVAPDKIKEIQREIADLQKYKVKVERLEEKARNKGKKKVTTDAETDDKEAAVDENDILDEMDLEKETTEEAVNESFLKMQKLAGLITEGQMREKLQKLNELDAPAYEFINDLMDEINMATGMKGKLTPYSKIPWLPEVHSTDDPENTWMLVYKKGNQEIAIGQDDVYQEDMWQINTNDPNLDFGQDLKANQVVDAVSDWLNS
jgi:hypothetical protein